PTRSRPHMAHSSMPQGFVLGSREGEHLIQRGGDIFINVDSVKGSNGLALGTQQIPVGIGFPIHRHPQKDEAFYVIEGRGTFILDDARHPIEKGSSIFISEGRLGGVSLLLWVLSRHNECPGQGLLCPQQLAFVSATVNCYWTGHDHFCESGYE